MHDSLELVGVVKQGEQCACCGYRSSVAVDDDGDRLRGVVTQAEYFRCQTTDQIVIDRTEDMDAALDVHDRSHVDHFVFGFHRGRHGSLLAKIGVGDNMTVAAHTCPLGDVNRVRSRGRALLTSELSGVVGNRGPAA